MTELMWTVAIGKLIFIVVFIGGPLSYGAIQVRRVIMEHSLRRRPTDVGRRAHTTTHHQSDNRTNNKSHNRYNTL